MSQAETTSDRVIYENQEYDLSISEKALTVNGDVHLLRRISAASLRTKNLPLWPGVLFVLWAAAVFYSDSLPIPPGVEPNHPLFKYVLIIIGGGWIGFRSNQPPKFEVHVTVDGVDIRVARSSDQMEAVEILTRINDAL